VSSEFLCQDLEAKLFNWFAGRLNASIIKRSSEMKNPETMSDAELLMAQGLYKDLKSKGVRDEIYISLLENEIVKRVQVGAWRGVIKEGVTNE
jgi:hypothetical protein